jgi:hypothetical protein
MGPGQDGGQRSFQYASIKCSCNTIKGAQPSFLLILQQNPTCKLTKNTVRDNCNLLQKSALLEAQKSHHGRYINNIKRTH